MSPAHPSSTGLSPRAAASLAYVAGPLSGALLVLVETSSRFVRFHAWQALVGFGVLGLAALAALLLAFLGLLLSPIVFRGLLWLSAGLAIAWVALWAFCLLQAWRGRVWKLPLAGAYAERRAGLAS